MDVLRKGVEHELRLLSVLGVQEFGDAFATASILVVTVHASLTRGSSYSRLLSLGIWGSGFYILSLISES